jgi:hypothetical protein
LASARKTNWSRRRPHPVVPLDGARMIELQDVVSYMLAIGDRHKRKRMAARGRAPAWSGRAQRAGRRRAPSSDLPLLVDGKLDAAATVPAG